VKSCSLRQKSLSASGRHSSNLYKYSQSPWPMSKHFSLISLINYYHYHHHHYHNSYYYYYYSKAKPTSNKDERSFPSLFLQCHHYLSQD